MSPEDGLAGLEQYASCSTADRYCALQNSLIKWTEGLHAFGATEMLQFSSSLRLAPEKWLI